MIEEAGLSYAPGPVVSSSTRALQLAEFARAAGAHGVVHPLLFRTYWAAGRDIGDHDVLRDVAAGAHLDPDEALRAVEDGRFADRVRASTQTALSVGADGVPAWLVDGRFLVPGAQPHEVFDRVMERLGFSPVGA